MLEPLYGIVNDKLTKVTFDIEERDTDVFLVTYHDDDKISEKKIHVERHFATSALSIAFEKAKKKHQHLLSKGYNVSADEFYEKSEINPRNFKTLLSKLQNTKLNMDEAFQLNNYLYVAPVKNSEIEVYGDDMGLYDNKTQQVIMDDNITQELSILNYKYSLLGTYKNPESEKNLNPSLFIIKGIKSDSFTHEQVQIKLKDVEQLIIDKSLTQLKVELDEKVYDTDELLVSYESMILQGQDDMVITNPLYTPNIDDV